MTSVENTLNERGERYGDYKDVLTARAEILNVLKSHNRKSGLEVMTTEMEIALGDLVLKLVRASTCPSYADSFHDLAGYSTLIESKLCNPGPKQEEEEEDNG